AAAASASLRPTRASALARNSASLRGGATRSFESIRRLGSCSLTSLVVRVGMAQKGGHLIELPLFEVAIATLADLRTAVDECLGTTRARPMDGDPNRMRAHSP